MPALLLAATLPGCSTLQAVQGTSATPAAGATTEQRLAALEAGLQQLGKRIDALQVTVADSPAGVSTTALHELPIEQQPLKPAIVLASNPPRPLPAPPAASPPPVRAPARQPDPPAVPAVPYTPPGEGDWVINLASYASASFASRKLAEFVDEGVPVEKVKATVKGKTIYRLCVPGFESYRAASAEAGTIRTKLGLSDTWVARR
jgi:hypothetical protein